MTQSLSTKDLSGTRWTRPAWRETGRRASRRSWENRKTLFRFVQRSYYFWIIFLLVLWPVLRIRDILVRIRICGSVFLTNGSWCDSGSCYFVIDLQEGITFWRIIFIIFYRKKSQNSRNQGFSYYFCLTEDPEPDPYLWLTDPEPGGPKAYGSVSAALLVTFHFCE